MCDQGDGSPFEHHFNGQGQAMEYFKTKACGSDFLSFIAFSKFKYNFFSIDNDQL